MENKIKLLLVEDDGTLTYVVKNTLEGLIGGYEVITAVNGLEGLKAYREHQPDVIISDVDMPVMNGLQMVERIREVDGNTPILLASALGSPNDVTSGYKFGADNYVKKPFVAEELDAHIRALLKLRKGQPSRNETNCYYFGHYKLDAEHATLKNERTGKNVVLSRREAGILKLLARNKNQVVKRGVIISHNWETQDENDYFISRSLDTYLVRLRKYLEDDSTVSIKTVRGVGLMLVEEQ